MRRYLKGLAGATFVMLVLFAALFWTTVRIYVPEGKHDYLHHRLYDVH